MGKHSPQIMKKLHFAVLLGLAVSPLAANAAFEIKETKGQHIDILDDGKIVAVGENVDAPAGGGLYRAPMTLKRALEGLQSIDTSDVVSTSRGRATVVRIRAHEDVRSRG